MSKLKGAVLDRAVANAMGLKSVHNCEKWGENMTFWKPEYANIGGFGDPTARYPMTKFGEASIKREGDIVDPDECTWECDCEKCQAKYKKWKEAFDAQQKQHEEKT